MTLTIGTILQAFNLNDMARFAPYAGALAGTIILGLLIMRVWKKTKIFKDPLSLLIIFTILIFGLLTFGAYKLEPIISFTYVYYIVILLSLIAGVLYTVILHGGKIKWASEDGFWKEFLLSLAVLVGILVIAIIIMVAKKDVKQSDPWLFWAFIPYVMPLVFYKAFVYWMQVPTRKFKTWKYPVGRSVPRIELVDTTLVHIDLKRVTDDLDLISTKIRAPRHERYSDIFFYFLQKYNLEKHPDTKIDIYENYDEQLYYEWVFYAKEDSGITKSKQYFNPDLKIIDLDFKENQHIIAERVY